MSEYHLIEAGNQDEASDQAAAFEVAKTLEAKYPNHQWMVGFQGRALVVRHPFIATLVKMELGQDGFAFKLPNISGMTPKAVAHQAMLAGGQMLEAFGLPRGAWDGREPVVPAGWRYKQQNFKS